MPSTPEIYRPLLTPGETRHLTIEEYSPGTQLRCKLRETELVYCPDYTALSYTWGPSTPAQEIWVQSQDSKLREGTLQVGQNLFDFLVAYATQPWSRHRALWIDQICINQSDQSERSAQVSTMKNIYKRSKNVHVWLGCESAVVEAARQVRDHGSLESYALVKILQHPYFSRVWIVQEVAFGSNITIVCGDVELTWNCLKEALSRSHFNVAGKISPSVLAVISESQRSHTLQECFSRYCQNNCRDPRDRVYGLVGLTPERWRLRIDYTKTVLEVYLDAVVALYEELFEILDPRCFYPAHVQNTSNLYTYCNTMLMLGQAMELPKHQLSGLPPFLRALGEIYMSTPIRNVRFQLPVSGPAQTAPLHNASSAHRPSRVPSGTSFMQTVTATRRNPFLRDIIPTLGLQLARTSPHAGETDNNHGNSAALRWDRWWFNYNGSTHHFDCPLP
jgi:hypothetical protein